MRLLLAFYRYYHTGFGIKGTLICAIATLLFSLLSWRFIETPLRYLVIRKRWVYLFYLIIPIFLSVTVAHLIAKNEGFDNRLSPDALQQYKTALSTYQPELQLAATLDKPFKPYLLGSTPELRAINKTKATLWGDSHAEHFQSFIDGLGKQYQFTSSVSYMSSCPPLLGADIIKGGRIDRECSDANNDFKTALLTSDVNIVFIAARWSLYTETTRSEGEKGSRVFLGDDSNTSEHIENNRRMFKNGLRRSITFIIEQNKTPVLFKQIPAYPFKPSNCWIRKTNYHLPVDNSCSIKQTDVESRQAYANDVIDNLSQDYPELIVISLMPQLCNGDICVSKLNETLIYKDNNHLNSKGGEALLKTYLQGEYADHLKALFKTQ